jgi:hypothetical protein
MQATLLSTYVRHIESWLDSSIVVRTMTDDTPLSLSKLGWGVVEEATSFDVPNVLNSSEGITPQVKNILNFTTGTAEEHLLLAKLATASRARNRSDQAWSPTEIMQDVAESEENVPELNAARGEQQLFGAIAEVGTSSDYARRVRDLPLSSTRTLAEGPDTAQWYFNTPATTIEDDFSSQQSPEQSRQQREDAQSISNHLHCHTPEEQLPNPGSTTRQYLGTSFDDNFEDDFDQIFTWPFTNT